MLFIQNLTFSSGCSKKTAQKTEGAAWKSGCYRATIQDTGLGCHKPHEDLGFLGSEG